MAADRPLIFSGESVRAILAGRKRASRRVARLKADGSPKPPPIQPGNRVWVREVWGNLRSEAKPEIAYRADGDTAGHDPIYLQTFRETLGYGGKWRSPIFMPRRFSRITLPITTVRVERLRDISAADMQAEGYVSLTAFGEAWDALNAKRGAGWATNPWAWVYEWSEPEVRG